MAETGKGEEGINEPQQGAVVDSDGYVTEWSIHAGSTKPVRLLIYRNHGFRQRESYALPDIYVKICNVRYMQNIYFIYLFM